MDRAARALLRLPALQAVLWFEGSAVAFAESAEAMATLGSLAITVLCGRPQPSQDSDPGRLAAGGHRRLGYRCGTWAAGIAQGVPTLWITVVDELAPLRWRSACRSGSRGGGTRAGRKRIG